MNHFSFISDLGIVLLCAAAVAVAFKRLKLPVFIGYILSGILVGPHLFAHPPVQDKEVVYSLSELGVIFLMFYIGMEFDLRRLRQVLGSVVLALFLESAFFIFIGLQLAPLLGWGIVDGLFLGALLAISSSMVTVAILTDLGRLKKPHAQLAFGVLILEDILAVMLLVVLSGVAYSGNLEWKPILSVTFFITAFVVVVYFAGKIFANKLLMTLHKLGDPELVTLCAVAWVLGVSILAKQFDFSLALGAFLAGSILSQSQLVDAIHAATEPMRNVFCAVFFVSSGMLIQPALFIEAWWVIVAIAVLVFIVKIASVWLGLVAGGQNPDTSFRAAVAKAQIGEFSFIIAGMGQTLGVTDVSMMTIAVGVSVLTTAMSLTGSKHVDTIFSLLEKRTPSGLKTFGQFYQNILDGIRLKLKGSALWTLTKRPLLQIIFNFFLIHGIVFGAFAMIGVMDRWAFVAPFSPVIAPVCWIIVALLCLPLSIAMMRNLNAIVMILTDTVFSNAAPQQYLRGRFGNIFNGIIAMGVCLLVTGVYFSVVAQYLPSGAGLLAYVLLVLVIGIGFWRQIVRLNSHVELMFMETFNQRFVDEEQQRREAALRDIAEKYPWPVNIREVLIAADSVACGQTLESLALREKSGASVVGVARGGHIQYDPGAGLVIFPDDVLYLLGSQSQNMAAVEVLAKKRQDPVAQQAKLTFEIEKIYLGRNSDFVDNTLAGANLRRDYGITVLGIQRGEKRITSPSPEEILEAGDVLYAIGNRAAIARLQQ